MFYTENRLSTVSFSHTDVDKIIQNLNPNKGHGLEERTIFKLSQNGISGNLLQSWP